jgi:hypothetical protein
MATTEKKEPRKRREVLLGETGYFSEYDHNGKERVFMTYAHCWHKAHFLDTWLRERSSRLVPFTPRDEKYWMTLEGWHVLKELETAVKYYCRVHLAVCDMRHPKLVEHEGKAVVALVEGKIYEGSVCCVGSKESRFTTITRTTAAWGRYIMPWHEVESVTVKTDGLRPLYD